MAMLPKPGIAVCCGIVLALLQAVCLADEIEPQGKPKDFQPGIRPAVAVYLEKNVWHIRWTGKDAVHAGSVRADADKMSVQSKNLDKATSAKSAAKGDSVTLHPDGQGFNFRIVTSSSYDEVTFVLGPKATNVKFALTTNGMATPQSILVGSKNMNPEKAIFTLPAQPLAKNAKK